LTTKPAGRGTGLGLSTALGTVKQSGGSLTLDSRPGFGTTVSIYLPSLPVEEGAESSSPAELLEHGDESVLLVEDDDSVRLVVREALESAGYRVVTAASPDEALTLASRARRLDLLLTDLVMPGMDGVQLTRYIRSAHPSAKVILTSGYGAGAALADPAGSDDETVFLAKPFSLAELAATVRSVLDS
jgi:CheY-like chemotaxis protein